MKKLLTLLFAAAMFLNFSACSKDEDDKGNSSSKNASSELVGTSWLCVESWDDVEYRYVLAFSTATNGKLSFYVSGNLDDAMPFTYTYKNGEGIITPSHDEDDDPMYFRVSGNKLYMDIEDDELEFNRK